MKKILNANVWLLALLLLSAAKPIEPVNKGRVFMSQDYGNTWRAADTGFPSDDGINTMIIHDKRVFAGTNKHGVWAMEKNAWYSQSKGLPRDSRVISLVSASQILFAGVYRAGLYYSTDDGQTWLRVPGGPAQAPGPAHAYQGYPNVRALAVYAGVVYAGTDNGIYRINVNGLKWELALGAMQINAFTIDAGHIYAATHKGAVRSRDGQTWESIYNGGAIHRIGQHKGEIFMLDYSGRVYTAWADKPTFILQDRFLPHVFFRLNPVSTNVFAWEWPGVTTMGPPTRKGLPADVPLNTLLQTSDGLLAAGPSADGC